MFRLAIIPGKLQSENCSTQPVFATRAILNAFLKLFVLASLTLAANSARASDPRGNQFYSYTDFSAFQKSGEEKPGHAVLLSPEITARAPWDELILSWDARLSESSSLKLEARVLYPDHITKYYTMALWSGNPAKNPRESVPHQNDSDGNVSTDTLVLNHPADRFQLKLTLEGDEDPSKALTFLGVCLTDTSVSPPTNSPNTHAWGKLIPVPEKSQMAYPNGKVLCSPTTVSMLMTYWALQLKRSDLDREVPEVATQVYDAKWDGTGNWAFNTAYAGSLPGIRAYVTRMSDISELEAWIAADLPVGVSLCYNKLRGKAGPPSGHLVVLVGFTKTGDVVINDPGTSRNVRKTFPRRQFIEAWRHSKNATYLIYPEQTLVPDDPFGHWYSPK